MAEGEVVANATTRAFEQVIRRFHETWYCIEPIRDFVIMPDHIHLIVKMRNVEKRVSLAVVVRQLIKALERAAHVGAERLLQNSAVLQSAVLQGTLRESLAASNCDTAKNDAFLQGSLRESIFEHDWHDWIVKKKGQLAAFVRYIRENPKRAWLRRLNRRYFAQVRRVSFAVREWFAYGNTAILELPVIELFGRMLFLSLYEAHAAKPDKAMLYRRCHEMGDLFKH